MGMKDSATKWITNGEFLALEPRNVFHINAWYIGAIKIYNSLAAKFGGEAFECEGLEAAFIDCFYYRGRHLFKDSVTSSQEHMARDARPRRDDYLRGVDEGDEMEHVAVPSDAFVRGVFHGEVVICI